MMVVGGMGHAEITRRKRRFENFAKKEARRRLACASLYSGDVPFDSVLPPTFLEQIPPVASRRVFLPFHRRGAFGWGV